MTVHRFRRSCFRCQECLLLSRNCTELWIPPAFSFRYKHVQMNGDNSSNANRDTGVGLWLIRLVVGPDVDGRNPVMRSRLGILQGWTSVAINTTIFLLKCAMGIMLGSIALIADSIDSLFDVVGAGVLLTGFYWSRKPRDREHPFGHGRMDLVAGLIMSILLIVVSVELVRASVHRILHANEYVAAWWVIGVVALTIPLKEWLARLAHGIAMRTGSASLEAGYWYQRFDAITSSVVCIGLILSRYGWWGVDGWIGLAIAGVIAWTGIRLVLRAIGPLIGEAPSEEEVTAVVQAAGQLDGARGVHDVIIHKYGDVKLVSLHVEVDARKSALDVHDLAERVEDEIERATGCKAIVHVDPVDRTHPSYEHVRKCVAEVAAQDSRIAGFHDLRVWGDRGVLDMSVDIVVGLTVATAEYPEIESAVRARIRTCEPGLRDVVIGMEVAYSRGESGVPG